MSGYLQRALSRGFGAVEASTALRPFVRSTSPIADMDQRIGLPDRDPFAASLVPQAQGVQGVNDPDEGLEKLVSVLHAAPGRVASYESGHRSPAVGPRLEGPVVATSERPAVGPLVTGPTDAGGQRLSRGPLASSRQEGRSPSVTHEPLRSPSNTPVPGLARDVLAQASVPPQVPGEGTSDPVPGDGYAPFGLPGPSVETSSDGAAGADREAVHDSEHRPPPLKPILSEPLAEPGHAAPHDDAAAPTRDPAPAAAMFRQVEDGPAMRAAPAPRVVIGEVNVEVVSPTAPGSRGSAPTRTPATAASVSQIGPLSSGLSARQRRAMRGR